MTTIEQDEDRLHQEAVERTGHSDFGNDDYREGLRVILEALRDDPDNEPLKSAVMQHSMAALTGRLHSEAGWKKHPECLNNAIVAPLVITGMPRTGTSLLHQLLSNDPQFQWMPGWIARAPRVREPRSQWSQDPDYRAVGEALEALFHGKADMRAAHNMDVDVPEECIQLMVQSFVSMRFISTLPAPRYEKWFLQQDETPSYRRLADNLRLIGAREPNKTWLLKNPSHSIGIDALLRVFPDARIVATHRDPFETIASGASVILRSTGNMWRKEDVAPHRLRVWARAAERLEAARARQPESFQEISYTRLIENPIGVVRDLYASLGYALTEPVVQRMQQWLADNPQGKHGKHTYSLESVGLDPKQVDATLGPYIKRYGFSR
ncbi:sulfotransferase family protein [Sphingobium chungbukense]|uniref:sulfotransferase family protein n=1 Tax=Sphingobium chungbukense TaxID=56193 RepID=UPI00069ACB88|nr:sulfotransferase [Sphingobium chungbukense]